MVILSTSRGNSRCASVLPPKFSNFAIRIPVMSDGMKNSKESLCVFEPVLMLDFYNTSLSLKNNFNSYGTEIGLSIRNVSNMS